MKLGILSDIHGNSDALERVLGEARKSGVEKLLIAGDFVGYYYNPDKVIELLKSWEYIAVKGNHENFLREAKNNFSYLKDLNLKYGSGISHALAKLSEEDVQNLISLPDCKIFEIDNISFCLFHGSPDDVNEYWYPDVDNKKLMNKISSIDCDVLIGGHTHYSCIFNLGDRCYINPGSVGQSRTNGSTALWGIYNTSNRSYVPRFTPYDSKKLVQDVEKFDPHNPYLIEVLRR